MMSLHNQSPARQLEMYCVVKNVLQVQHILHDKYACHAPRACNRKASWSCTGTQDLA